MRIKDLRKSLKPMRTAGIIDVMDFVNFEKGYAKDWI